MTIYFGGVLNQAGDPIGSSTDTLSGYTVTVDPTASSYAVCPGAGSQLLVELGAYVSLNVGSANIRIAIYDNATPSNLIAQTGSLLFNNTSLAWVTGTSFFDASFNPITPVLTGGNFYLLIVTEQSAGNTILFGESNETGTNNPYTTGNSLYSGYTSTLDISGWSSDGEEVPAIRAGITSNTSTLIFPTDMTPGTSVAWRFK